MCGRYASTASPAQLAQEFEVDDLFDDLPGPDYNVAPTVAVPAVFERRLKESGEVRRRLAPLVWGLVPSWAKDAKVGSRMINARVETVAEKSAYAKAFRARRCLLPAAGFYEWYSPPAGPSPLAAPAPGKKAAKPVKQPFYLHRTDGGPLVMAGIYEIWRDPSKERDDESAWLRTCSVITTTATDAAGHIHDRMPMVVPRESIDRWLDPALTDPAQVLELLAVTEADALEAYAVSTAVNSVQNNDPSLLEPLAESDEPEPGDQGRLL
ncbi:SOS response-associated peptidase [uncultured Friedmanniella sp.]|uniref:SOS response-associated peptidase n=1 Tax=uncultured Friedmanniella sp. TaxID=335381 RepID=UPI0035CC05AE